MLDSTLCFADRTGSIIAMSDANGVIDSINTYDEFGVPGISASDRNTGRFRYTRAATMSGGH